MRQLIRTVPPTAHEPVVETEGAAGLLETLARERAEDRGEVCARRSGESVDKGFAAAAVGDFEFVLRHRGEEFVAVQLFENVAFRGHRAGMVQSLRRDRP